MNNLLNLKKALLDEAISSPNLLSDIAGLEMYVAESYNSRSLIELLQNADDAGATKFYVEFDDDCLFVANNGHPFTDDDLNSLCRSASSTKQRGITIGYRGIGFKSVVGFANRIHLISGEYEITFSKEETMKDVPLADKVPLIRIPHEFNAKERMMYDEQIIRLQRNGCNTIFIFPNYKQSFINTELSLFSATSILFLHNVSKIMVLNSGEMCLTITKEQEYQDDLNLIRILSSEEDPKMWIVTNSDKVSIAINVNTIDSRESLTESEALIYSFLPTEDSTGFGFIVNGDFSTDPSRRHLILDEYTKSIIDDIAKNYCLLLEKVLQKFTSINKQILSTLIPFSTPELIQFKSSSFTKELIDNIKRQPIDKIKQYKLCPSWLNLLDYEKTFIDLDCYINRNFYEIDGFAQLMSFLGCQDLKMDEIHNIESFSDLGCAEILKKTFLNSIPTYKLSDDVEKNLKMFVCEDGRKSLIELTETEDFISPDFIVLLNENSMTENDILTFFAKNISKEYSEKLSRNIHHSNKDNNEEGAIKMNDFVKNSIYSLVDNPKKLISKKVANSSLMKPKWRSAEIKTLEALNSIGFNLKDVTKQNIGYDLEGMSPNGNEIFIEIKSIRNNGDKIEFTNNEYALAQNLENQYYVAVVRDLTDELEISLIQDPANMLSMDRQAIQWKWVCDDYDYEPVTIEI